MTLQKHPSASVAIAKQRYDFLSSTGCLTYKLLRTSIITYGVTEPGQLAASVLPAIHKSETGSLVLQQWQPCSAVQGILIRSTCGV